MVSLRCAILIPVAWLAACAGGTTVRVAQDSSSTDAVALAPTPAPEPDSGTARTPAAQPPAQAVVPDSAQPAAQGYAAYGSGAELETRRIGQWTRTGIGESRRLVIRDANAWADLWSELGAGDRPAVDFTRNVVVVAAAGQRPTGGYEIAVDGVRQTAGELTIQVVETTPGPNCSTTASSTQPVDVVVVPAVKPTSWSFVDRKEVRGCR